MWQRTPSKCIRCLELQRGQVGEKKERKINKCKRTGIKGSNKTPIKKSTEKKCNVRYRGNLRDVYRRNTGD